MTTTDADVLISHESSLTRITPMNADAREWLEDNCQWESYQRNGATLVCDRRMADDIIAALVNDGYTIEVE